MKYAFPLLTHFFGHSLQYRGSHGFFAEIWSLYLLDNSYFLTGPMHQWWRICGKSGCSMIRSLGKPPPPTTVYFNFGASKLTINRSKILIANKIVFEQFLFTYHNISVDMKKDISFFNFLLKSLGGSPSQTLNMMFCPVI